MSHVITAISENTLKRVFENARDNLVIEQKFPPNRGNTFQVGADIRVVLIGGDFGIYEPGILDPNRPNLTIGVKELDIIWEQLILHFGVDIPEVCIGEICLIPTPLGCALHTPKICFFSGNPDIAGSLDISNLLRHEISFYASPHITHPMPRPTKWEIGIDLAHPLDIDLIDISDIIGDIIDRFINVLVDELLSWLPDWARDIVKYILGNLSDLIRKLLDLADDIQEWLGQILGVTLDVIGFLIVVIADYCKDKLVFYEVDDPYEVMEKDTENSLPPVKVPTDELSIEIEPDELVAKITLGR